MAAMQCFYLLEILAGQKETVLDQTQSPCYLEGLGVYWRYYLDWVQVDPLLNAAVAAVVAAGLVEVGTACGFAVDPGQEVHGSCLKKTSELQDTFTFIFFFFIQKKGAIF